MEPQDGETPFQAQVKELNGKTAVLETLHDYMHSKNNVWGITARNREQNFAFNILLNPDIDIVTLVGQAGTGKTLLALAAGLAQAGMIPFTNSFAVFAGGRAYDQIRLWDWPGRGLPWPCVTGTQRGLRSCRRR